MRIAGIGAGAMGPLYAGLLARSGQDVSIVDGWVEHLGVIREHGLRLSGITGQIQQRLSCVYSWEEARLIAGQADCAVILAHTNDTNRAAEVASIVLKSDGFIYGLQNGIGNLEIFRRWAGVERVLGGLTYHSAAIRGAGHAEHTHAGPTWLGELDGRVSSRLGGLAEVLKRGGFDAQIVSNTEGQIWTKFIHK